MQNYLISKKIHLSFYGILGSHSFIIFLACQPLATLDRGNQAPVFNPAGAVPFGGTTVATCLNGLNVQSAECNCCVGAAPHTFGLCHSSITLTCSNGGLWKDSF